MPPQKPVRGLRALAKDKVLYGVCAVILDEIHRSEGLDPPAPSARLCLAREELANSLAPGLLEDLLDTILSRDEAVEAAVRYLALRLLLVGGVRRVAVGRFPESYYLQVLEATALGGGEGLRHLDLRGLWAKEEGHRRAVADALGRLPGLTRLTLRHTCDDGALAALGGRCRGLEALDVSGSAAITEEGLRALCEGPARLARSLRVVDLGGPGSGGLPPSLAAYLLLALPGLESLGSYERAGAAVEEALGAAPARRFGLRYLHDVAAGADRLSALAEGCPGLRAVYLDSPKGGALRRMGLLAELREVKLNRVRWGDVEAMLAGSGPRVTSLFLLGVFGRVDLNTLGRLCPDLHRLEIHGASLACSEAPAPSPGADGLGRIRELIIYASEVSAECARLILTRCEAVEHLCLGECRRLSDASVAESLTERSLLRAREIWFGSAENLGMGAVEALLGQCPRLTSLGNLAAWGRVHPGDLDFLRLQLLLTNTDLTLHEYGPKEDDDDDEWILVVDA